MTEVEFTTSPKYFDESLLNYVPNTEPLQLIPFNLYEKSEEDYTEKDNEFVSFFVENNLDIKLFALENNSEVNATVFLNINTGKSVYLPFYKSNLADDFVNNYIINSTTPSEVEEG